MLLLVWKLLILRQLSGSNSVVECQLPKLDVAGSTPVSRSNFFNDFHQIQLHSVLRVLRLCSV